MPTATRKNRVRNTLQLALRELAKALDTAKTSEERERALKEMIRIGKQLRTHTSDEGAGTGLYGGGLAFANGGKRNTRKHKRKN
jgi:hypothetical protein